MTVCILGNGLTALTLAKALVNCEIDVDLFSDKKNYKRNDPRTIGIAKNNINFFNRNIINIENIFDYLTYLKSNKDEIVSIKNDFLIGVTQFFRDEEAFKKLQTEIIPAICQNKKNSETIRIWSAGCSTGAAIYVVDGAGVWCDCIAGGLLQRTPAVICASSTIAQSTGQCHLCAAGTEPDRGGLVSKKRAALA